MSHSLSMIHVHLEAAQRWGCVWEWCLAGPYIEITWADRSRSLVPRARVVARLQAQAKAEVG